MRSALSKVLNSPNILEVKYYKPTLYKFYTNIIISQMKKDQKENYSFIIEKCGSIQLQPCLMIGFEQQIGTSKFLSDNIITYANIGDAITLLILIVRTWVIKRNRYFPYYILPLRSCKTEQIIPTVFSSNLPDVIFKN